jgi:hypothetical protein
MSDITIACKVSGIPCQAELISYAPFRDGRRGHIDNWLPDDPAEVEFQILDRKGRYAEWLERKMTEEERWKIEEALEKTLTESSRDYPEAD